MVDRTVRVLGIDPGSRVTGWGVIELSGGNATQATHIAHGCLRLGDGEFADRLRAIHQGLQALVHTHQPGEVAIEDVFVSKNAMSALKLGQARGAAISAVACLNLQIAAYPPAKVKQSLVGHGRADKDQVSHMVCAMLGLTESPPADAADALAIAIAHAHWRAVPASLTAGRTPRSRSSSWRNYQP